MPSTFNQPLAMRNIFRKAFTPTILEIAIQDFVESKEPPKMEHQEKGRGRMFYSGLPVTRDLGHVPIGKAAPPLHRHTPKPPPSPSCLARSAPSSAQVTDLLAGLGHDLLAGAGPAAFAAFRPPLFIPSRTLDGRTGRGRGGYIAN